MWQGALASAGFAVKAGGGEGFGHGNGVVEGARWMEFGEGEGELRIFGLFSFHILP